MQTHYAGRSAGSRWKPEEIDFMMVTTQEPQPTPDGWVAIEARMGRELSVFYLKKTDDGYKIDWMASVGFNTISPASFRATKPLAPVRFRAIANLADYYNFDFFGRQDVFWSVRLEDTNRTDIGHGYVRKDGPDGYKLFQCLKDGQGHRVVVDLHYTPWSEDPSVFMISRVVATDSWWYPEGSAAVAVPKAASAGRPTK